MKNEYLGVRAVVLCALFSALVTVMTLIIRVPVPATKGYFNLGDALIFITAALLGPGIGAVAGGLGSSLADIIGGYALYAPWTFFIKGIEGFMAGFLVFWINPYVREKEGAQFIAFYVPFLAISFAIAALWMVTGYFIAQNIMFGFRVALVEVPINLLQGGISALIALIITIILKKTLRNGPGIEPE